MLINYQHYTAKEIIAIVSHERQYFSRHSFWARGKTQALDAIVLEVEFCKEPFWGGTVRISCEVESNYEGIREILREKGFVRDEVNKRDYRLFTIPFTDASSAEDLLDKIMAGFNEALKAAPLFLYASPAHKALADYQWFMKSDIPKVSYRDIMQHLGYEYIVTDKAKKDNTINQEYLITQYRQGRWAAWASGDLIVPLFSSEYEAEHFLRVRAKRAFPVASITIKKLPSGRKTFSSGVYKLVDNTRSTDEKIAWLQREIARLRSREKSVG